MHSVPCSDKPHIVESEGSPFWTKVMNIMIKVFTCSDEVVQLRCWFNCSSQAWAPTPAPIPVTPSTWSSCSHRHQLCILSIWVVRKHCQPLCEYSHTHPFAYLHLWLPKRIFPKLMHGYFQIQWYKYLSHKLHDWHLLECKWDEWALNSQGMTLMQQVHPRVYNAGVTALKSQPARFIGGTWMMVFSACWIEYKVVILWVTLCAECERAGYPVDMVPELEGRGSQCGRAGEGQLHNQQCFLCIQHWYKWLGE